MQLCECVLELRACVRTYSSYAVYVVLRDLFAHGKRVCVRERKRSILCEGE